MVDGGAEGPVFPGSPSPLAVLRLLALSLLLAGCASVSPRPAIVALPSSSAPTALVATPDGVAVGADAEVRWVHGGAVVRTVALPGRVLAMAGGAGDTLWAATDAGLFAVTGADVPERVALPAGDRVLAVAATADGRVWASVLRGGVFARAGGQWTETSGTAAGTGIAPVGDVLWLGTHQGVVRQGGGASDRFTEEGTTEHGLIDNVVDRLFATADGVVWAAHPAGVSVFADGEPHGYPFVGGPGGTLHDALALPGGGHLLATSRGPVVVPALSDRPSGFYEVYADSGTEAVALAGLTPPALAGSVPTRLALGADGRTAWLASQAGVWSVRVADLAPALAAR